MIHLFTYLILIIPPTGIKLIKDRNGIQHPDPSEAWFVLLICVASAGIACILNNSLSLGEWVRATCVSGASFWLLFPYLFNFYWFDKYYYGPLEGRLYYTVTHLSNTAIPDKWTIWRKIGWLGIIIVYLLIFTITVIIYERRISLF